MKMEPKKIAEILRRVADAIEPLDSQGLAAFLEGLSPTKPSNAKVRRTAQDRNSKLDGDMLAKALSSLQKASSRVEGSNLLAGLKLNRTELVALAKAGNVHVTKEDTVARLEEKLIESLIGSRLNSQAIRGSSQTLADRLMPSSEKKSD